jgi:hypothetical protein
MSEETYPEAIEQLIDVIRRRTPKGPGRAKQKPNPRGKPIRPKIFRNRMVKFMRERLHWTVEINKAVLDPLTGTYKRTDAPSVVITHPYRIAIELSSNKPVATQTERLSTFDGFRVILLTNTGEYDPNLDKRGQFHRISDEQLSQIDYLIGVRTATVKPQTPEEIQRGYHLFEFDDDMKLETLKLIQQAWESKTPLSDHANVRKLHEYRNINGERYLPAVLNEQLGVHHRAAQANAKRMKAEGLIEHSMHPYYRMRGFRLTKKGGEFLAKATS